MVVWEKNNNKQLNTLLEYFDLWILSPMNPSLNYAPTICIIILAQIINITNGVELVNVRHGFKQSHFKRWSMKIFTFFLTMKLIGWKYFIKIDYNFVPRTRSAQNVIQQKMAWYVCSSSGSCMHLWNELAPRLKFSVWLLHKSYTVRLSLTFPHILLYCISWTFPAVISIL